MSRKIHPRIDRRAHRTRAALAEALMALGARESVDGLEVLKLTKQAGIGRSTFYKHFSNKDDFFISSFAGMIATCETMAARDPVRHFVLPAREILAHVSTARDFARSLIASGQYARTQAAREAKLRPIVEANLKRLYPKLSALRRRELAVFLVGAFVSLMRWWIETGFRQSAGHVSDLFEALARRALASG